MRVEAIGKGRSPYQWQPPAPFLQANADKQRLTESLARPAVCETTHANAWPATTNESLAGLHCSRHRKQMEGLQELTESLALPAVCETRKANARPAKTYGKSCTARVYETFPETARPAMT